MPPQVHKFDHDASAANYFHVGRLEVVKTMAWATKKWIMNHIIYPLQRVEPRSKTNSLRRSFATNIRCRLLLEFGIEKPGGAVLQRVNVLLGWSEQSNMLFEYTKDFQFWATPARFAQLCKIDKIMQFVMFSKS